MEPCIMKDKRSTPRFHTIKNFWNIMDDKDSKTFQREKEDSNTKDQESELHTTLNGNNGSLKTVMEARSNAVKRNIAQEPGMLGP